MLTLSSKVRVQNFDPSDLLSLALYLVTWIIHPSDHFGSLDHLLYVLYAIGPPSSHLVLFSYHSQMTHTFPRDPFAIGYL